MKLTVLNRLKICLEVLTIRSGHKHAAHEKELSIFKKGYACGLYDGRIECDLVVENVRKACAQRAEDCSWSLSGIELRKNIKRCVMNA